MTTDEFVEFSERWYPDATRYMQWKLQKYSYVDDAVQTVFQQLWQVHERLQNVEHATKYLWILLKFTALATYKVISKDNFQQDYVEFGHDFLDTLKEDHTVDDRYDSSADLLLNLLDSRQREIIQRNVLAGESIQSIATEKDISAHTIQEHRNRALQKIRMAIELD